MMLNRRTFLQSAGAAALCPAGVALAAEPQASKTPKTPKTPLTLWGPPAAPSIALAQAVAGGALADIDASAVFRIWRTPDEMRAGLSSGSMQAVIVPSNVAANLYNRGLDVRLLNILTRGLLYLVADEELSRIEQLAGKSIAVPFRNDMPDLILRRLLGRIGLKPGTDVKFDYAGSPTEAMQMLLAGRVAAALLSEPAATTAILRAKLKLTSIVRAIDCQKEWAKTIGGDGFIPQAGLAVTGPLIDRIGPGGLKALQNALQAAVDYVVAHPVRASVASAAEFGLMSAVVAEAIPHSNLVALSASSVRPQLEAFFSILAQDDPRIIGGKLPDDTFYAL